jgi:MFS family permease
MTSPATGPAIPPEAPSAWSPLRQPLFRALWIATVASNVGTWMQNVGAVWLMTSLTSAPLFVALVQTATSLPVFLVGLAAGALADVVDRRRLLLFTQGWMLAATALLGALTLAGVVTPWVVLGFTFLIGLGAALNGPAWQAITPELVPREELPAAVALGGVGFNLARAVGPALGGAVVAAAGAGMAFLLNAVSFLGVMLVLYCWRREPETSTLPGERVLGAVRAGLRYVRYAPALPAVLVRAGLFILCGSALWALLPLVARHRLGLGPGGYGLLLGGLGVGAVAGAALLPGIRRRVTLDRLVSGASLLFAAVTVVLAYAPSFVLLSAAMIVGGATWMGVMSSLNVAAQMAAPAWVRARALGVYLLVFQGGFAAGSALWGGVAARAGEPTALACAAVGLVVGLVATRRYPLADEEFDLTPSMHWPEPVVAREPDPEQGPVLITVEYWVAPEQSWEFVRAMREVRRIRRRDGAMRWGLFYDVAEPRRFVETFLVESWAEHLRQHERVTAADRAAEERARAFHRGESPPIVSHLIAAQARPEHR